MDKETDAKTTAARRRRASPTARPGEDAKPFSIRLTDDERRTLLARAGRLPLGTYIRQRLFDEKQAGRRKEIRSTEDHAALARVLGALGQSRIANNLNQLAKAVNLGVLPVNRETESDIADACRAVLAMRADLMAALGIGKAGQP